MTQAEQQIYAGTLAILEAATQNVRQSGSMLGQLVRVLHTNNGEKLVVVMTESKVIVTQIFDLLFKQDHTLAANLLALMAATESLLKLLENDVRARAKQHFEESGEVI